MTWTLSYMPHVQFSGTTKAFVYHVSSHECNGARAVPLYQKYRVLLSWVTVHAHIKN
jgi:hypothetical protein